MMNHRVFSCPRNFISHQSSHSFLSPWTCSVFNRSYIFFLLSLGSSGCSIFPSNWMLEIQLGFWCPFSPLCSFQIPCLFPVYMLPFSPPWALDDTSPLEAIWDINLLQTGQHLQLGTGKCFQTFLPKVLSLQLWSHCLSYFHSHNS